MERDDLVMIVARNIEATMKRREMNPASLARAASMNPTGIYDILSGKSRSPRLDTIHKIAKALNVPVYYLFEDDMARKSRDEVLEVYGQLPPEERSRLILTGRAWLQAGAA